MACCFNYFGKTTESPPPPPPPPPPPAAGLIEEPKAIIKKKKTKPMTISTTTKWQLTIGNYSAATVGLACEFSPSIYTPYIADKFEWRVEISRGSDKAGEFVRFGLHRQDRIPTKVEAELTVSGVTIVPSVYFWCADEMKMPTMKLFCF